MFGVTRCIRSPVAQGAYTSRKHQQLQALLGSGKTAGIRLGPEGEGTTQSILSIRISRELKAVLTQRAKLRGEADARKVTPGEIARDLLVYALQKTDETQRALTVDELLPDVLAACFFSRRALSERLFRARRAEATRRIGDRRL